MNLIPSTIYIIIPVVLYILISYQYRKINKSIFISPLLIQILTFTISFSTVLFFYELNFIEPNVFFILIIQFIIYFIFFMMTPHFIKKKYRDITIHVNIRKFDLQMAKYIFLVNLFISLLYIGILWGSYTEGSDRMFLNKNLRSLSLLTTLFTTWSMAINSLIYVKTKNKKYLYYAVFTLILSTFMGSKGVALVNIFIFMFFYLQYNTFKTSTSIKFFIISSLLVILPTEIMYGNAIEVLVHRIFMSGDVYLFSFIIGDYRDLIGFYDPIKYILHPFTSLVGIRGYDFPYGAQILSTANMEVSGVGPQGHMTMLALIFFDKCVLCIVLFSILFAGLTMVSTLFAFYFFSLTKIHLFLRTFVFIILYTTTINIFVGVNAYSFSIVLIILSSLLYFLLLALKKISLRDNND